jgi:CRISPR-associated Cas5-like protein
MHWTVKTILTFQDETFDDGDEADPSLIGVSFENLTILNEVRLWIQFIYLWLWLWWWCYGNYSQTIPVRLTFAFPLRQTEGIFLGLFVALVAFPMRYFDPSLQPIGYIKNKILLISSTSRYNVKFRSLVPDTSVRPFWMMTCLACLATGRSLMLTVDSWHH